MLRVDNWPKSLVTSLIGTLMLRPSKAPIGIDTISTISKAIIVSRIIKDRNLSTLSTEISTPTTESKLPLGLFSGK